MPEQESPVGGESPSAKRKEAESKAEIPAPDRAKELKELAGDVLREPPYEPPAKGAPELTAEYEKLVATHAALMKTPDADDAAVAAYAKALAAYNERCRAPFVDGLREGLGLHAVSPTEFRSLLKDIRTPITSEANEKNLFNEEQQRALTADRAALVTAQGLLLRDLDGSADNLRFGYPIAAEEASAMRAHLIDFLKRRWRLDAEVKRKEPEKAPWMAFMGVAFQEILEEAGESSLNFGEQSVFKKYIPGLEKLDAALMAKLESGAAGAGKILAERGLPSPKLVDVVRSISKMPFGKEFWEKLLTVESPVTVALFAFYLHGSKDKVKAALQFASFLATSAVTSELLGIADKVIFAKYGPRAMYAMRGLPMMRNRATRRFIGKLTPKNPAIQFAVMLAVMFGINEILDKYVISPTVEAIPDGDFKHGLGGAISTLSGDATLGHIDWALQETGLQDVDPENEEAYLSQEYLTDTTLNPLNGLDTRFVHTTREWNDKLQSQIDAEAKRNPLRAKMLETHRIDNPQAWSQRKAATELFPLAQYAKQQEGAFLAELRGRKDCPIKPSEAPRLLSFATADTDAWDADLKHPVYTVGRNDRALDYVVDRSALVEGKISGYVKALPEKDPLKESWKDYMETCQQIAKKVALYRHLDVGYDQQRWLGDMEHVSEFAKQGFIEAIIHTMKRERAYEFTGTTTDEALQHAANVGKAVKVEKNDFTVASIPSEMADRLAAGAGKTGGNIASDLYNLRGIVTGERESKFQTEIRDATSGEYAFGDKRLNQKNSLTNLLQTAASTLPPEKRAAAQEKAKKLAASTELASVDDMRDVQQSLMESVGEHADETMSPYEASAAVRSAVGIASDVPVLMADNAMTTPVLAPDIFQKAFGGSYAKANDNDAGPLTPRLYSSDVVILQYIQPRSGAIAVNMNVVHCAGTDRKNWTVEVIRATYESGRGNGYFINRKPRETVDYVSWAKRQAGLKDKKSPLSERFAAQEKMIAKRQEEARIAAEQEEKERQARLAASKLSNEFVEITDEQHSGEFRRKYGDRTAVYKPDRGTYVSAARTEYSGTTRYSDTQAFRFELRSDPEQAVDPWVIGSLGYLTNPKLTEDDKKTMTDILTTPNVKNDEEALWRILNLSEREVYRPNMFMRGLGYGDRFYAKELHEALLPLYQASKDKRTFLRTLVDELAEAGFIGQKTVETLPRRMAELE